MGLVLWQMLANPTPMHPALRLGLLIFAGMGVYLILIALFRSEEIQSLKTILKKRN